MDFMSKKSKSRFLKGKSFTVPLPHPVELQYFVFKTGRKEMGEVYIAFKKWGGSQPQKWEGGVSSGNMLMV